MQEARLNSAYSALMRQSTPAEKKALRASEIEWLTMRAKKCALPLKPGLSDLVDSRECHLNETILRIGWLEQHR